MFDIDIRGELANVNSSQAFWRAMGSNFFEYGCSCSVSHAQNHFVMKPSYLDAQREITKSHKIIFEGQEGNRSEALANLLAVCKVQDQLSGEMSFSSKKTSEFKKQFGIKDCENGFTIEGQEYDIRDQGFKTWLGFNERKAQEENLQETQILDLENGKESFQKSSEKEEEEKVEEKIDEFDTKNLCISIPQDKKAISKKKKLKKNDQVSQTEFEKKDISTQTVSAEFYEISNVDSDSEIDLEKISVLYPKGTKLKQQQSKQLTTHV